MIPTHARRTAGVLVQLLVCLALVCASPVTLRPAAPDASNVPELPRTYLDTTYALPAGGTVFNVTSPATLQTVLDLANPGDVIVLTAGMTYTGNFTLRNQSGPGWIYVISSALASLPAPGTRVTPSAAGAMPKIVTTNQAPAIGTDPGAHHYRFVGIEIATTWATTADSNFGVVELDAGSPTTVDQLPHHITFDRCYIHGTATGNVRRGIAMNSAATAVIDSYLAEFHELGTDSQALASWNGPGPFKIVNNYLSAAGENVMFGGAGPSVPGLVPSDIEIRSNYIRKSLTWMVGHPSYAGTLWSIKNLLEFKQGRRVLVEGNVLENSWVSAQTGFALLVTPRSESGEAVGSTSDITIRLNRFDNVAQGFSISGEDDSAPSERTHRVLVQNNVVNVACPACSELEAGDGRAFQVTHGPVDLVIEHNTVPAALATLVSENSPKATGFIFRNNIVAGGANGVTGSGNAPGTPSLDGHYTDWVFVANAIFPTVSGTYPSGNFFPADLAAVGFTNVPAGDYSLAPGSPFKNAGTDGRDLGADIDAVTVATNCAITATCGAGAPLIGGVQVSGRTFSSATIAWVTNQVADSQVEYGLTSAYGSVTALDPSVVATHSQLLTGLTPASTYHCRVMSTNSGGLAVSGDFTFTTLHSPPVISALAVSSITPSSATVSWTTDQAADSQIEYGVTTAYGNATALDATLVTTHGQSLAGLGSGTTYHYRVRSRNSDGVAATSADATFVTQAVPVITNLAVSNIQGATAAITWQTDLPADTQVEYGLTTSYGTASALNTTLSTGHGQAISGLIPGTLYHLRARSRNALGNLGVSSDTTFTTAPAPVITAVGTSGMTATSAVVSWTTDLASSTKIEYGLTGSYGSQTPLDPALVTSHSQTISGLNPGTTYFFLVRSITAQNALTKIGGFTLTTMAPPVIGGVGSSAVTGTSATINWSTNHAANSQVEYGPTTAYGSTTTLDATLVTTHVQALTGLTPLTTYHYRVKSQSPGGSTTSGDFTFATPEPPPVISNVAASALTTSTATITWTTDRPSGSVVEYGLTSTYGSLTIVPNVHVTSHTVGLTGLALNTTYHYRVASAGDGGTTSSTDATFTTLDLPPAIAGVTSSSITTTSATIGWTTDRASTSEVEYGVTTAYGNTTGLNPAAVMAHSQPIAGLTPGTAYHYRVKSTTSGGATTSADAVFTTLEPAPVISNVLVSAVTATSATIGWTTDRASDSQVEYGLTIAYGSTTPLDATLVLTHSQPLSALAPGATYHYRVKSRNADGQLVTSADGTFTTVATPIVTSLIVSNIQGATAAINWQTDLPSDTQVEFGLTTAYGTFSVLNPALSTGHGQAISGLIPGTLYHLRARSRNAAGTLGLSADVIFTTAAAPVITAVATTNLAGTSVVVTWTTDLPSNSKIEYGLTASYGSQTTLDPALVTSHSHTISGLTPGTTYFFLVRSITAQNALSKLGGFTFTTLGPPVISGVGAAVTSTSATINWTTNHGADSQVEYGLTTAYGSSTALDAALVTAHSQGLTGLTPLTTYHYRVKSQSSGGSTTSADFTLTTVEPPPIISGVVASAITTAGATIGWTTDRASDSQIEYGLTTAYGGATTLVATPVTAHTQILTGLTPGTLYHYRVRSATAGGPATSADGTFTTLDPAPLIADVSVSAVATSSATVTWTTDRASDSQVEYGLTSAYGNTTTLDATPVTAHSRVLAPLTPGVTYHYRVKSKTNGGLSVSGDFTFTTLPPPPVFSNILASGVTTSSAVIQWTTDAPSDSQVEYGLTTAYGSTTAIDDTLVALHAQALSGLTSGSTYHYRVKSRTAGGLSVSGDFTFTTDVAPPVISNVAASATMTSAAIGWTTDLASDSQIEYGLTTAYGGATAIDATLVTTHSQVLAGLTPGTLYHYRVKSRTSGGLSVSGDQTFTTLSLPAPAITNVVISNIQGASAAVTWHTDQPADTQIEYGLTTAYGSTTVLNSTLMPDHGQAMSGLQPGTTYQLRIRARNAAGILGTSGNVTFTTAPAPVITAVATTTVTGTSVVVTWTTDLPSNSKIEYGLTLSYGSQTTLDPALVTSHSHTISGLTPGVTYFFLVRSITAQNALAKLGGFTVTTLLPPVIGGVSSSNLTGTSATINWTTNQGADSQIEYGPTTAYGTATALDATLVTTHAQALAGLTGGNTYHYRVKSRNGGGLSTSNDFTFTTPNVAPTISNVAASGITISSATIGWTTDLAADSQVEYGLTTAYGSATALDPALVATHAQSLSGLTPATTYHYRVKSRGSAGLLTSSPDATFTTLTPPVVTNVVISNIQGASAAVTWHTDQPTDTQIEYGVTTAYGSMTALNATLVPDHGQAISGLQPGTTYQMRVRARNAAGSLGTSGNFTFTTAPAPVITAVATTNLTPTSVVVTWTTDLPSNSKIEYGLTLSYGSQTTLDPALVTSHSHTIPGLTPGTTYFFLVRSITGQNALSKLGGFTFTTPSLPVVPESPDSGR